MEIHRRITIINKFQITKSQMPKKFQLSKNKTLNHYRFNFVIWNLWFVWCLGFGFLDFSLCAQDIQGKITLAPPLPAAKIIHVTKKNPKDPYPEEQISQALLLSADGGVKNAVISIKEDFKDALFPKKEERVIDQKNYHFEPHILLVEPSMSFDVTNLDPVAHDVRIFKEDEMLTRFEIEESGNPVKRKLDEPGIYTLRCGLHKWMHGFIVIQRHPFYAVSAHDGAFTLKNVPAGKYTLQIWHETLGEVEVPIEVADSITDFSYTFKTIKELI